MKLKLTLVAVVGMVFGFAGTALAFHSGGVAECVGCHSMHSANGGALLAGSDESSTCLNCHNGPTAGSYKISTDESVLGDGIAPLNHTPGGDFAWLKKDYTWIPRGTTVSSEEGHTHGHNIIAADYNYAVDPVNATAPGGTMNAAGLGCNDCHDQHSEVRRLSDGTFARTGAPIIGSGSYSTSVVPAAGQAVGVYRFLRSSLSDPGPNGTAFSNAPVMAVTPSTYNRSEATTDTRVAYGRNMSAFCSSCHPDMHTSSGRLVHPVDQNLGSTIAALYNSYVGSGDLTNTSATSYDSLIPFAANTSDFATLAAEAVNNGSVTTGPGTTDQVFCLSCHRAHASGWEFMTRWDNEIELLAVEGEWPGTDAATTEGRKGKWAKGRAQAERLAAYNDAPATDYATYQRVLCNKCHAKD